MVVSDGRILNRSIARGGKAVNHRDTLRVDRGGK